MSISTDGVVLVQFGAKWCVPCQQIKPWTLQLARETLMSYQYIDIEANPELAEGVRTLPTIAVYKDGIKLDQVAGANRNAIENMAMRAWKKHENRT